MSAREWWQWTVFAITGRVPGEEKRTAKEYTRALSAPPSEEATAYMREALARRRVVTADEAAGLGLVDNTAPLDNVYRERARLVAWLAALYPSALVPGADTEEPDWAVLFITLPTGQVSWHVAADDWALFHHVDLYDTETPGVPEWDGHSTDEKYERIAALIHTLGGRSAAPHRYLSTGCLHGEHGYCQSSTGSNGTKVPASCKFCGAGCECGCHGGSRDEFGLVSCPHCTDCVIDLDQHWTSCREVPVPVPVPRDALRRLVEVARWVSGDPREAAVRATCADTDDCCSRDTCRLDDYHAEHPNPRPYAKAGRALAALDDAGLLDQFREEDS